MVFSERNAQNPQNLCNCKVQNKANRYYFKEALTQERRGVYLSQFDLNVEEGAIEYPLKPVLRFSTPVFDRNAHKRGILVVLSNPRS